MSKSGGARRPGSTRSCTPTAPKRHQPPRSAACPRAAAAGFRRAAGSARVCPGRWRSRWTRRTCLVGGGAEGRAGAEVSAWACRTHGLAGARAEQTKPRPRAAPQAGIPASHLQHPAKLAVGVRVVLEGDRQFEKVVYKALELGLVDLHWRVACDGGRAAEGRMGRVGVGGIGRSRGGPRSGGEPGQPNTDTAQTAAATRTDGVKLVDGHALRVEPIDDALELRQWR